MTSADRWLSHYSFRLRNVTQDSPEEGLDGSFRRMAQALATYETPITFQVQLLDGETSQSWCLELTPNGSTVQAEKRDHPDFELMTHVHTWREIIAGSLAPFEAFVQGQMRVRGDVKLGRRLLRQIASPEDKPEIRARQIPQLPQANILFTTGWVDCVTMRNTFGGVQITEVTSGTESFIIWQGGPPSLRTLRKNMKRFCLLEPCGSSAGRTRVGTSHRHFALRQREAFSPDEYTVCWCEEACERLSSVRLMVEQDAIWTPHLWSYPGNSAW